MERTFAGFWVDGAVRVPDAKHWSDCKCIFAIQKHDNSLDICLRNFNEWVAVYWLDTTTHTELTPQQAFEISKIIYPDLHEIEKAERGGLFVNEESTGIVNWNGITEYPPLERWRVPTDADRFHQKCRVKHSANQDWQHNHGRFICYDQYSQAYLLIHQDGKWTSWTFCEVLDE